MSDEISAASLLMAIVAVLYGAWYQEIMLAINITIPKHDKQIPFHTVHSALFYRCLPLTIMAVMIFLVFTPSTAIIIIHSIEIIREHGFNSYSFYDPVRTAFCFVIFVSLIISVHLLCQAITLTKLLQKLK